MTTAVPVTQADRTVTVQDMQVFSLGQRPEVVGPEAFVPGLGNAVATYAILGSSSSQELKVRIAGLSLTTDTPAVVMLQPRQSANQDFGYHDEFAVQVIDTSRSELLVLIRRLDLNSGWGQQLRLDIFIVDSVINP